MLIKSGKSHIWTEHTINNNVPLINSKQTPKNMYHTLKNVIDPEIVELKLIKFEANDIPE